jgi:transcriptional regulator with XRE-family HTH domain
VTSLRKYRLENGLTQAEVADNIGVTPTALGQWEANKRTPSERFLPRVASLLGYKPPRVAHFDRCATEILSQSPLKWQAFDRSGSYNSQSYKDYIKGCG